ncbi:hypothetical protein AXK57_21770 [Tsukamurella pulmonis]|nr:hypothetical protein AXK57_21770 [Tsukamurella pulmonis]
MLATRAAALTLTAAVAVGAFAVSFHALTAFAAAHAVPDELAWIWAAVVDATILAGTLAHVALPAARRPQVVFLGGTAVSIAANALHAWPAGTVAVAVAVIPPIALAVLVEQCIDLARGASSPQAHDAPTPPQRLEVGKPPQAATETGLEAPQAPDTEDLAPVRPLFGGAPLTATQSLTDQWTAKNPRPARRRPAPAPTQQALFDAASPAA